MNEIISNVRTLAAVLLVVTAFNSSATERKVWEKLINCQYLATPHGDGDSFRVSCGVRIFEARLYYVDAPETKLNGDRVREQRDYFNITLDDVLNIGNKANARVQAALNKPFTIHTRWAHAGGRSTVPRYYVLVEVDGKSLIELLVSEGLVRIKGVTVHLPNEMKSKDYKNKLKLLEEGANRNKIGAWKLSKR